MQQRIVVTLALVLACGAAGMAWAGPPATASSHSALWKHGKYLVTRVGICSDCHTPRGHHGRLIKAHALQGAHVGFKPIHPIPGWAAKSPDIAGLPTGWTFKQMVHFLETGVDPKGGHADPPMPAFRFNARDARAVATYLQSLPRGAAHRQGAGKP